MFWLLVGYMFLFIHRPFEFWPALGDLHIERRVARVHTVSVRWPATAWRYASPQSLLAP